MTSSRPNSLLATILLSLACVSSATAQELADGLDRDMLRICPELADSSGRDRDQLMALFFDLDPSELNSDTRASTRALFDLSAKADVALLGRYLDAPRKPACMSGLRAVFLAHEGDGLLWLLERYAVATPDKRGRLITLLADFEQREAWDVLQRLLRDATTVPNKHSARIAPPSYRHLRVCDHALRALGGKIAQATEVRLPGGRRARTAHPTLPMKVRTRRVKRMAKFLSGSEPYQAYLIALPSLHDRADAARHARVKAALARLGLR